MGTLGELMAALVPRAAGYLMDTLTKPRQDPGERLEKQLEQELQAIDALMCRTPQPAANAASGTSPISMPQVAGETGGMVSTEDTVKTLRRRLGRELYQLQADVQDGCRIAGKPCDCCQKHVEFGVLPVVEELLTMETDAERRAGLTDLMAWGQANLARLSPAASASGEHTEWYQNEALLAVRALRKRALGTESLLGMVTPDVLARAEALAAQVKRGELSKEAAVDALVKGAV